VFLALLMLLDAQRDLGLPFLQLTRFFVIFVLRNSPSGCSPHRGGKASLETGDFATRRYPDRHNPSKAQHESLQRNTF
jgi:hypothetical protein